MSSFQNYNGSMMSAGMAMRNDLRLADETVYRYAVVHEDRVSPWEDARLWPSPGWLGGEMGMGMLSEDSASMARWAPPPRYKGSQSQLKIRGTTRDSAGVALGSVTVQGFVTSTDAYVSQVVSDSGGYFEFCTQYSGAQHYLVAYKGGSPDIAGTTVNTLTPS